MVCGRSPSEARSVAVSSGEGAVRGSIPSEGAHASAVARSGDEGAVHLRTPSHGHMHSAAIANVEGA
eukprot:13998954-Alexandrium_andersonii.AAC.1